MRQQTKLIISIIVALILLGGIFTLAYFKFADEDGWICQQGQWIKHGQPDDPMPSVPCSSQTLLNLNQANTNQAEINSNLNQETAKPEIIVNKPKTNETISTGYVIEGLAKLWYFEGVFPFRLLDENGKELVTGQAEAQSDWMSEEFVPFKATLTYLSPKDQKATLILMRDNPSGLAENDKKIEIPILLKATDTLTIKIFFGNEQKNPGAMDCSKVYPVERQIPKTVTTAKASLEELLKGPTEAEVNQKYFTSINNGVTLNKMVIKDGVAYADFSSRLGDQVGGSCKVTAIRSQITQTLNQFSSIKNVVISIDGQTEDILQP